ncbi:Ig-like domain-containing protein [Caproiciproducens sp. R2]|uniref:Ig-like domain-containing protein n=1 Tax=Caproiciproducens sp. R2 TaxID=3435187 RepID=UPI004034E027
MKKITGKVVSLVLALALVVTSFSANFAFAAKKSASGTVSSTNHDDEIYLVNGDKNKDEVVDLYSWLDAELETKDHQDIDGEKITAISHASGDKLVKWSFDDDDRATLELKDVDESGKEVLSVLYEGTYYDDDDNEVTVKARKDLTVYVLDKDEPVFGVYDSGYATKEAGTGVDEVKTFAQTKTSTQQIALYKAAPGTDAKATYQLWTPSLINDDDEPATTDADFAVEVTSGSSDVEITVADQILTAEVGKRDSNGDITKDAGTTNVVITAKAIKDNGDISGDSDDKYTLKTKIEKKIDVAKVFPGSTSFTVDKDGSKTVLTSDTDVEDPLYDDDDVVVTNCELVFPDNSDVTVSDGSVKKISGKLGDLDITGGSVSEIDVDSANIAIDDAKVGDITIDDDAAAAVNAVEVTSGSVGDIEAYNVTIEGGTVGAIDADGEVNVNGSDEETPVSTGKITADTVTAFDDDAKVSINGIVASDEGVITLKGENVTVGSIDFDHYAVTLNLGEDDEEFVGTIKAPANAEDGTIATQEEDTKVSVTGAVDVDTISVSDDTSITFDGAVTVDSIEGDGIITIKAGSLYVTGGVSGATLKLSDTALANGTTVFKADEDTVEEDDFETYGYTLEKSTSGDVDTFKIASLSFAGIQVNKTSSSIAVGYSETFTASAYPGGTALPTGSYVEWDLDGNDEIFDVTTNGNTATVKVLKTDADFASENKATLTATLYDEDGYELDDYGYEATVDLTATTVPVAVSDTNDDFSVAKGSAYQFKITSATVPTFTTGTAGVFKVELASKNGNDYFYKITAIGNVGAATGIYLNGTKLLVATVKAPAFTTDTTKDLTVKGAYTVKVTAAATPSFAVGTAGVFKAEFVSKNGNDYLYKITSVGAVGAKAGIYVNGVKTFVATVG